MSGFEDSAQNLKIVGYSEFDKPKSFAYKIDNIVNFVIRVDFPTIAIWDDANLRARLQDRLHDDVSNLLRTSEFYSINRLEQTKAADHFAIEYTDDIFDFKVYCYQDNLTVVKGGVLFSTFHHWYHAAVPSIRTLIESMLSQMSTELHRQQIITNVEYRFKFITYELREGVNTYRNYEILKRLITKVPGPDGVIAPLEVSQQEVSRTNYLVNCWHLDPNLGRRLLSYSVQAPANRQYSGLWFEFAYRSDTYTDPKTGKREWQEPALLLEEYEQVYDFLWHKGLNGFMRSILEGVDFKTTATYIP